MSIVVLGACFLDYVGYVERLPAAGETIAAKQFAKGFGGKGANQAVMAGRLGGDVRMVSVVGDDGDGENYIQNFKSNGIDTAFVSKVPGASTGLAMIAVSDKAENDIVICRNATDAMTPSYLVAKYGAEAPFLKGCKIFITQNEVPLETTLHLLKRAHELGITTIFNSAPAPKKSEVQSVLAYAKYMTIFSPNETEAELITGVAVKDVKSAAKAIAVLHKAGVKKVVLTLGSNGCLVSETGKEKDMVHLPAQKVKAIDTTGAGDCFIGSMAYFMTKGDSLLESCRKANICAAYSVQRKGTQTSFPKKGDIPDSAFSTKAGKPKSKL
jgi:ribokinase